MQAAERHDLHRRDPYRLRDVIRRDGTAFLDFHTSLQILLLFGSTTLG